MATAGYLFNERPPAGFLIAQAVGITAGTYLLGQYSPVERSIEALHNAQVLELQADPVQAALPRFPSSASPL